jgi:thymidylate synthase
MFDYLPLEERSINTQYRNVLQTILDSSDWSPTRQGPRTKTAIGAQMRFNLLQDGFPLITERKIGFWRKGINELGAMINGVRTLEGFEAWGCGWWSDWTTEEKCAKRGLATGDIGPASYGAMFHDWPDDNGQTYDQFAHLVRQIQEFPYDKTHMVSPWNAAGLARDSGRINKATIAPCHGWVQVTILGETLHLHMTQRSGDVPIGVPSNMIQYAALQLLLCEITGYVPGQYVHTIVNAHIYEDQMEYVDEMLSRDPLPFPTMQLTMSPEEFKPPVEHDTELIHKLHGNLFEISDYYPHPAITGIPVAV